MKNDKGSGAVLWVLLIVLIIVVAFVVPWTLSLVDETGTSGIDDWAILGAVMCVAVVVLVFLVTKLGS